MNDEACTTNGASSNDVVNSKARKEKKEIEKKKKEARIAVANETAEKIFSMAPCEECIGLTSELQKIQKALKEKEVLIKGLESSAQAEKCIGLTSELQKVQETLKEKEVLIKDLESSVQAKKRVIKDLESELKAKKTKVAGNIKSHFYFDISYLVFYRNPFDFSSIAAVLRKLNFILLQSA